MTLTRIFGTLGVVALLTTATVPTALAGGMHLNEGNGHDSEAGAQMARGGMVHRRMMRRRMMHYRTHRSM